MSTYLSFYLSIYLSIYFIIIHKRYWEKEKKNIIILHFISIANRCGSVQQTKTGTFLIYDNRERDDAEVAAVMHVGQTSFELPVTPIANMSYVYEFQYRENQLGVAILEVYVDGLQIPESPFRVEVVPRDCNVDFPGQGKEPVSDKTAR